MLDVDNEGGYACVGQGYMGNLYICLSFAVNKKTALKSNLYYKIGDVVYRKKCQGPCYYEISCVHLASVFFREEVGKH